ncbi:hypothetical protein C8J56DRAFT_1063957 [Mycena floridula]|nr:hypothetical protein C8J56DRAFT_1063957 [Mycena floridula]
MSFESAPESSLTLYQIKTDAAELVIHINGQGMQSLQTNCPTPRHFIFQVIPAKLGGKLCLGRARPFDLGSNNETLRWNMGPAVLFQPPPDGWYAVKVRLVPGVYQGWTNTICSALAGLSDEDTEYKFFPIRDDAIDQFAQWAAANQLKIVHCDGSYRATLGSYVDLDELTVTAEDEHEEEMVNEDAEDEDNKRPCESSVLESVVAL